MAVAAAMPGVSSLQRKHAHKSTPLERLNGTARVSAFEDVEELVAEATGSKLS